MDLDFLLAGTRPVNLRHVNWPKKMKCLVTAPHPDDFDAIGVTLKWLMDRGHEIHAVVAETGSGIDQVYGAGLSSEARRQLRVAEQTDSFRFFTLPEKNYRFLRLDNAEDDQVAENEANVRFLEELVGELKPDVLFMPHGNDTNRAHRAMYCMMKTVACRAGWAVALMLNSDAKTRAMRKDGYMAFGEKDAAWKGQLLRCHVSQHQRNLRERGHGFDERVLALNHKTAVELGLGEPWAESFEIELCR